MSKELELFNKSRVGVRVVYDEDGVPREIRPGQTLKVKLSDNEAKRLQEFAEGGDDLQLASNLKGSDRERAKVSGSDRSDLEREMDEGSGRRQSERDYLPRVPGDPIDPDEEKRRQKEAEERAKDEGRDNPDNPESGGTGRMVNQGGAKRPAPEPKK